MNHEFLIVSAQLNQTYESYRCSEIGAADNGITRRSFIKRSGGATVGTIVAWNLAVQKNNAQNPEIVFSGSHSAYAFAFTFAV
jgi:hypothetical protein